ncbi:hypothetical protein PDIG_21630 [Penicillium digitatum PHI26]|uniref:Uncharacterized protein n=2 Tax=Penicillium digitatum TaxID=36651 RepID=K9G474_PEND2|nr:hypothetical protein PDIP_23910 [Penicillium digitatum Pd1]EKV16184.1 hypothetical protein PDIG_21630 [Penicillium digitatum PHI26]EKV19381.1 hypothetical protein PDIP_23910 [Penicillium digitatum Pd1]
MLVFLLSSIKSSLALSLTLTGPRISYFWNVSIRLGAAVWDKRRNLCAIPGKICRFRYRST